MTEVIKNFFIAPIIPFSIFIALLKNIDKIELDEDVNISMKFYFQWLVLIYSIYFHTF